VKLKKSDYDEADGMNQEVASRDRMIHIETSDRWFSNRNTLMMLNIEMCRWEEDVAGH